MNEPKIKPSVWMCRLCYQFNAVAETKCMNCGTRRVKP